MPLELFLSWKLISFTSAYWDSMHNVFFKVPEISLFVAYPTSMVSSNCPLRLVLFFCSAFIGYTLSVTVIEYHLKHAVISFNDVVGMHECPGGLATHDEQRFLRIH